MSRRLDEFCTQNKWRKVTEKDVRDGLRDGALWDRAMPCVSADAELMGYADLTDAHGSIVYLDEVTLESGEVRYVISPDASGEDIPEEEWDHYRLDPDEVIVSREMDIAVILIPD